MDYVVEISPYYLSGLDPEITEVKRKNSTNSGELWLKASGKTMVAPRDLMNHF